MFSGSYADYILKLIQSIQFYADKTRLNIGIDQIAAFHINDSKNEPGAHKDRHENFGKGFVGADALMQVISDKRFEQVPKILETPYLKDPENPKNSTPPYKEEIAEIRKRLGV